MTRARDIANFGDGIATADIDDGAVTAGKLNSTLDLSSKTVTLPAGVGGKVLQVVTQEFNTSSSFAVAASNTAGPHADIFSASITPSSASSKILVFAKGTIGGSGVIYEFSLGLKRNGSLIGGNSSSNFAGDNVQVSGMPPSEGPMSLTFNYLDSPSTTSSTSYTLSVWGGEGATYYINRGSSTNSSRNWANSGNCSLTLMEIAG